MFLYASPFKQISQSIEFIIRHWASLIPIVLLPTLPVITISIFAGTQISSFPTSFDLILETLLSLLKNLPFLICMLLLLIIQGWSNLTLLTFLKKPSSEPAVKAYLKVLPNLWPYLGTSLFVYFTALLLAILFVFPGIFALFFFSLFEVVMVMERKYFKAAAFRSASLIKKHPVAYFYRLLVISFTYLTLNKLGSIIWPIDLLTWLFFPSLWFLFLLENYHFLSESKVLKT